MRYAHLKLCRLHGVGADADRTSEKMHVTTNIYKINMRTDTKHYFWDMIKHVYRKRT